MAVFNPNRAKARINSYVNDNLANQVKKYPEFFMGITFVRFRHISNLPIEFRNPITVISGTNRSGKTTTLMAIACSHYHFMRRNVINGNWERAKWSDMMRFTRSDHQNGDWTYNVSYRISQNLHLNKQGQHKTTGKWNGVGKKEGQIGQPGRGVGTGNGRRVYLIDVNRINPGRHLSKSNFNKVRGQRDHILSNGRLTNAYISYIFESNYDIKEVSKVGDGHVYNFKNMAMAYSSFNTASGEDVLISMLSDISNAENNSLILIDEIEMGLHPKIQRRLMDILYHISRTDHKQFIITTHSYAILDSVDSSSRIFINGLGGNFTAIPNVPTAEVLTRMDQERFPVVSVYVEDDVSKRIVDSAIEDLNAANPGFARLLTVVPVGSADDTFRYFQKRNELGHADYIERKAICILDGDKRNERNRDGSIRFQDPNGDLFFHLSNDAPEKMLLIRYLASHPNATLQFFIDNDENPHVLFRKMFEQGVAASRENAMEICLAEYLLSADGSVHFQQLKNFLMNKCQL